MLSVKLSGAAVHGFEPQHLLSAGIDPERIPTEVCLGRRRPAALPAAPRLKAYLDRSAAAENLPKSTERRKTAAASLARMYMNDRYGCCVIAGKFHSAGLWSGAKSGAPAVGTDAEVLAQYQSICGPGDNGCIITAVLDVMRSRGLTIGGQKHTIDGYVLVDWKDRVEVSASIYLLGADTIGINLPEEWTQSAVWKPTRSQIVGGHDVPIVDFQEDGVIVASWARTYLLTWDAMQSDKWVEEHYGILAPDWYGNDKLAPCGLDAGTLAADLQKLGRGELPDIPGGGPAPTPGPAPSWFQVMMQILQWLTKHYGAKGARRRMGTVPWKLIALILSDAATALPIVAADISAGKDWDAIVLDVYAAIGGQHG